MQVARSAASLNSFSSFVIQSPTAQLVWHGRGSKPWRRRAAERLAAEARGERSSSLVEEGGEAWGGGGEEGELWASLEGGEACFRPSRLAAADCDAPRLFRCRSVSGAWQARVRVRVRVSSNPSPSPSPNPNPDPSISPSPTQVANRAKEKAAELEAADGKALPRPPASEVQGEGDGAEGAQVTFVDDSPKVSPTAARKQALEQRLLKAGNTGAAGGATGGFNNLQDERVLLLELLVGLALGLALTKALAPP